MRRLLLFVALALTSCAALRAQTPYHGFAWPAPVLEEAWRRYPGFDASGLAWRASHLTYVGNPLQKWIRVQLDCGPLYDLQIPPRTTQVVLLGPEDVCKIISWSVL